MEQDVRKWTIWEVNRNEDHYCVRVGAGGGPPGNTCTVKIKEGRLKLLLEIFNVKNTKKLRLKTFPSRERTGSAALYDFLLASMQIL